MKNGTIRFVTDFHFRKNSTQLIVKNHISPYPNLKIKYSGMIRSIEGLIFATSFDSNSGYHHIKLDPDTQIYVQLYSHGI
jgi:hypothetical protein